MLCEITIENVAVIEKATAVFGSGFNVLTGETGAGKSILIDSINAILGNRTSRDIVRSGAAKAAIWATFRDLDVRTLNALSDAGYEVEDELLLYREVSADGKSSCRINGMPATAAMLREVCGGLVNIHGQHDNQSLMNPVQHIGIIDAFAENSGLLKEYKDNFEKMSKALSEMRALSMNEAEKRRKVELLRYETEEIESAKLEAGEEEQLVEQRDIMRNAQNILSALNNAYLALNGGDEENGAALLLADAAREMTNAATYAPDLAQYAEPLNEAYYSVSEIASDIQNRLSDFEFGDQSLEEIEQRLDLLYRLKQKYGPTIEDVMAYGDKAAQTLAGIESSEERLAELEQLYNSQRQQVARLADQLTQSRKDAFDRLNNEIADALAFLNMPGITMALRLDVVEYNAEGQDELEFYISTNPGETPKPLAKIASGGELARIMLALKSALADRDAIPTVIYDEIDTGISGSAAGRIGQLLRDTARGRQVICVTHTAQVAAYARRHLLIQKQVTGGRTFTDIQELARGSRIEELARIISGDRVTDIAIANAKEMLEATENG